MSTSWKETTLFSWNVETIFFFLSHPSIGLTFNDPSGLLLSSTGVAQSLYTALHFWRNGGLNCSGLLFGSSPAACLQSSYVLPWLYVRLMSGDSQSLSFEAVGTQVEMY